MVQSDLERRQALAVPDYLRFRLVREVLPDLKGQEVLPSLSTRSRIAASRQRQGMKVGNRIALRIMFLISKQNTGNTALTTWSGQLNTLRN